MDRLVRWNTAAALLAAALAALAAILPSPLYRAAWLSLTTAFGSLHFAAFAGLAAAGLAGLGALVLLIRSGRTRAAAAALLVAGGAGLATVQQIDALRDRAGRHPLHDVTSDMADPPRLRTLGVSDLGQNAARLHRFQERLTARQFAPEQPAPKESAP
ncbi:hypothetical protein CCR85_11045 [Rhodothalassium salexigens]|uniref:hypothetical protein n=1 Tax=Rhodothalassium salexigens TaxID=1086 RepID=UPI001913FD76|nr:hypothetical protein [Rhodothalassium salexigens]MBK5912024.1 hypothetical protein [Rhodothalassium salexigens]